MLMEIEEIFPAQPAMHVSVSARSAVEGNFGVKRAEPVPEKCTYSEVIPWQGGLQGGTKGREPSVCYTNFLIFDYGWKIDISHRRRKHFCAFDAWRAFFCVLFGTFLGPAAGTCNPRPLGVGCHIVIPLFLIRQKVGLPREPQPALSKHSRTSGKAETLKRNYN